CGVLEGYLVEDKSVITGFIAISNRATQPHTSFSFDAEQWVSIVMNSELRLIGLFHSHPTASAIPSREDLNSAWNHLPVQLIIAMQTGQIAAYSASLTKNHPSAKSGEWFNDLNIHISHLE
ncbi:MAG: Prokaryotic s of the domain, partial [Paenibacillus sp.]|nr:Prokaryotic s of the domain [Paenibacillus sp.]